MFPKSGGDMLKTILTALAIAATFTQSALAGPFIDFEGVGRGANVADFYNGGTDSFGNRGTVNYGIHFDAVVAYNADGAYVKGHATMSFSPDILSATNPEQSGFAVKFLASVYDDEGTHSDIFGANYYQDSTWVAGTRNPACNGEADCKAGGWYYTYPSTMSGYKLSSDGTANFVDFRTGRLDNIEFVPYSSPDSFDLPKTRWGSAALDVDIPEPASLALFVLAATGLAASRRKPAR
jgi:hypothetical protein